MPRRYRLHLSTACPSCRRIAVIHGLLGLDTACPVELLGPVPDDPDGGPSVSRARVNRDATASHATGDGVAVLDGVVEDVTLPQEGDVLDPSPVPDSGLWGRAA